MKKLLPFLKIGLILGIFLVSTYLKYRVLDEAGGDLTIFRQAVTEFMSGKNPYSYTVASFKKNDPGLDHGYAYFPTMLYIYTPLYSFHLASEIPLQRVWKASVFLVEIGVALMIIKVLYKKDYLACLAGIAMWFLNPFLIARNSFVYTEPFGILFMLLALYYLEKNDLWSGVFFAISFSFKVFPIILFPVFLLKSEKRLKFILGGAVYMFVMSVPFMGNWENFWTYIQGSLLVHGMRDPQGRPLLFFISNYLGFPPYSLKLASFYKYMAILLGWVVTSYLLLKKKVVDKYVLSVISFAVFYIFTPVLTRTYMLWFIPIYAIGMYKVFEKKNKVWYYLSLVAFYAFYAGYLAIWTRGIRITDGIISL
ncbi:MAG: hypothetical protein ABIJ82_00845 [Patescibacteria group bacterium]